MAFRAATAGRGGRKLLFRCSFCNRVSRTVDWCEVDEAMVSRAAHNGDPVAVAYTVCPDCRTMAPLHSAYLATVDGEPA